MRATSDGPAEIVIASRTPSAHHVLGRSGRGTRCPTYDFLEAGAGMGVVVEQYDAVVIGAGLGGTIAGYQRNPGYRASRDRAAAALLRRVQEDFPALRGAVVKTIASTPLTNFRYTRNRQGAIYGSEQSVHGMYGGRLAIRSAVPDLFLAGAWTNPGGGQSAALISGRNAGLLAADALGGVLSANDSKGHEGEGSTHEKVNEGSTPECSLHFPGR